MAESSDPHQLYDLQDTLDGLQVYLWSRWKRSPERFTRPRQPEKQADISQLLHLPRPGAGPFPGARGERQEEFRRTLRAYVRLYAFISHVMPFTDTDLEKLYTFGRFLLLTSPGLQRQMRNTSEEVQLKYYRIKKLSEGAISLIKGGEEVVYGPTDVGQGRQEDVQAPLSAIIELLNEAFRH